MTKAEQDESLRKYIFGDANLKITLVDGGHRETICLGTAPGVTKLKKDTEPDCCLFRKDFSFQIFRTMPPQDLWALGNCPFFNLLCVICGSRDPGG